MSLFLNTINEEKVTKCGGGGISAFVIDDYRGETIIIYGAMSLGRHVRAELIKNIPEIDCGKIIFADINLAGKEIDSVRTIHPDEIVNYPRDEIIVLITAIKRFQSVCNYLMDKGIDKVYHVAGLIKDAKFNDMQDSWEGSDVGELYNDYKKFVDRYIGVVDDRVELKELGIVVTQRCTLRCRYCTQDVPSLSHSVDFEVEKIVSGLQKFIECIDRLGTAVIIGGEVFLHKSMNKIVDWCASCEKIARVNVLTNATVVPGGRNLECLKHNKVKVFLDDYGKYSSKFEQIYELLSREGIYVGTRKNEFWYDLTEVLYDESLDIGQLEKKYADCEWSSCYNLFEEKLYNCTYSAAKAMIGVLEPDARSVIDFGADDYNAEGYRLKLKDLLGLKYIDACRYCRGAGIGSQHIPVAEQIGRPHDIS